MRPGSLAILCCALTGCGRISFDELSADASPDASDSPTSLGPWSAPSLVGPPVMSGGGEDEPTFTDDKLVLIFRRIGDLYESTRATPTDAWGTPTPLTALNDSVASALTPGISPDGLTLYFISDDSGGAGGFDLFYATRPTRTAAFGAATNLAVANTADNEQSPQLSRDGTRLYYTCNDFSPSDDLCYRDGTPTAAWGPSARLAPPSSDKDESAVRMFLGERGLIFYIDETQIDLYEADRMSASDPFGTPYLLTALNTSSIDWDPWISEDGRLLMWSSDVSGRSELYQATR